MSFILLVGAGFMFRSFATLKAVDTGVKTERLIVASIGRFIPNAGDQQQVAGHCNEFRRVRNRLESLSGVSLVSAGD